MTRRRVFAFCVVVGLIAACGIGELDLTGKHCDATHPCVSGFVCDTASSLCVSTVGDPGDGGTTGEGGGDGGGIVDGAIDAAPLWPAQDAGTQADLRAVWGSSSTDVYVVGAQGTILHSTGSGGWTRADVSPTADFYGVWGAGGTTYAVGSIAGQGAIFKSTGGAFVQMTVGAAGELRGISGTPSGSYVVTVGPNGAALRSSVGSTTWEPLICDADAGTGVSPDRDMRAVWVTGPGTGWIATAKSGCMMSVGQCNGMSCSGGTSWFGTWGMSDGKGYVVGAAGSVASVAVGVTNGAKSTGVAADLYGVWVSSLSEIYAVGAGGTLVRSTDASKTWTPVPLGVTRSLFGVWGSGTSDIYIVGERGTILHSP